MLSCRGVSGLVTLWLTLEQGTHSLISQTQDSRTSPLNITSYETETPFQRDYNFDDSNNPDKPRQLDLCEFGVVYPDALPSTSFILAGGSVIAGVDVHAVAPATVPAAAGTYYAYIPLNFTANTDDLGEYLLSGISASNIPNPIQFDAGGYPAGTDPTASDPDGSVALPLGVVVVDSNGVPTFTRAGCGHIEVSFCPGTVSIVRGFITSEQDTQIEQNSNDINDIITILTGLGVYP